MGTTQVSIYDMQLQTKYKLLSEQIPITDFIQNISTQSVCVFSIYDMQLQTKYKLLSEQIPITDFIQNISTQSAHNQFVY